MNHSIDFIQDCFLVFDKVGDNKIALSQVGDLSRALGLNPTNKDISRVTPKNADPNQARITLDQFMPIYHDLEKAENSKEFDAASFKEGFKVFDNENKGSLPMAELKHILTKLGDRLSNEEAEAVLLHVVDSDGRVDYDKLINYVTATN